MIKKLFNWLFNVKAYYCHSCKKEVDSYHVKHNKFTKLHVGCGGYVMEKK